MMCRTSYENKLKASREWKKRNADKIRDYRKSYYEKNKLHERKTNVAWIKNNIERYKKVKSLCDKKYREINADKIKQQKRLLYPTLNSKNRERYKSDSHYKINKDLRALVSQSLRFKLKKGRIIKIEHVIGCDIDQFTNHIEKLFDTGMTWLNYGEWQLDHIVPVKTFNLDDKSHRVKCFHYTNYQPLWLKDHQDKSARENKVRAK